MKKPGWLNKKVDLALCRQTKKLARGLSLSTVCEQARCPNISECFAGNTATFMILGDICTRNCAFCGVTGGQPGPVDKDEPRHVAQAVAALGLEYVVITSPTRDDLDDGGAGQFSRTIACLRDVPRVKMIEVLVPDFLGSERALGVVLKSRPDVIGHNVETVPALYPEVRARARYSRSLELLSAVKRRSSSIRTKSGMMLGLGEEDSEVEQVLSDLRGVQCDFLSLGQYLTPSRHHYPVRKYVTPEKFMQWREKALAMGFSHVASAPYVRSSYQAHEYFSTS